MSYKIEEIEGIGSTYAAKLNKEGIITTTDLLERCGTKQGRVKIAELTHIPESLILTWVNHSDLMRLKGVAGQISELLEAAGIDSVPELKTRNATNLHAKLVQVNEQFGLSGRVPSVEELQDLIDQAKALSREVTH
ncbi:MAG TPA: DUF4332 domain-containing protein [Phnomibacter sp.]|nr:DUF4332 domain-containing protein [Phnomibacter sp.]